MYSLRKRNTNSKQDSHKHELPRGGLNPETVSSQAGENPVKDLVNGN